MRVMNFNLKCTVTALCVSVAFSLPSAALWAQDARLADLYDRLEASTPETASVIEEEIRTEWGKSGSPAMDLLLQRGRDALGAGDLQVAVEHFTALTDHAPDFAQGWNHLATAYYRLSLYGPALDAIERTLALEPMHFDAMTGLAVILDELGYAEDALEAYEQVRAIHPHRDTISTAMDRLKKQVRGQDI